MAESAPGRSAGSIVIRMTTWYAGTSFLLILIATSVLYGTVAGNLRSEDRRILIDSAANLALFAKDAALVPVAAAPASGLIWFRLIASDGTVLRETAGMGRRVPLNNFAALLALQPGQRNFAAVQSAAGVPFDVLSERFDLFGGAVVAQVAIDRARDQAVLIADRERLLFTLVVSLGLCASIGYAIARGGIRPVARIAVAAGAIRATTLHARLETGDLPDELQALAGTFNDMLDRLEASFAQISQFSADVAHELRTPVNNLRGELEVALGRARAPMDYREVLGSALEECGRISKMVDGLLFLARAEAGEARLLQETLDVAAMLAAIKEFYDPAAVQAGVTLVLDAPVPLAVLGERVLLQQAVGNLVANALAHTQHGGRVTLRAIADGAEALSPRVRIEVADTGCGIAPVHLPHVFDRFYRADPARSSQGGNVGLGLAVVRSIALLHGGGVALASEIGVGTTVSLVLPMRRSR